MEQYFEITKKSIEYDNYFSYLSDANVCREIVDKFFTDHNIVSDTYSVDGGKLWISDNSVNRVHFESQLSKDSRNGLVAFRKNSHIGRAWNALSVKVPNKPFVPFFFNGGLGRMRTRLFHVNERVYCSIEGVDYDMKFTAPVGFVEMKASEFFKVLEDNAS